MSSVTVSPKYQVVIPQNVRERMKLRPGQKLEVFYTGGSIKLVPVVAIEDAYGMFKGIDTDFQREKVDRDPRG